MAYRPFNYDIGNLRQQYLFGDGGGGNEYGDNGYTSGVGDYMPPPSVGPVQSGMPSGMPSMDYSPWPGTPKPLHDHPMDFGNVMAPGAPSQTTLGAPPQITPPRVNTYDYRDTLDLVNKSFTPEFTDRNRLRALMDAAPEREKPGWLRGLSAIGVGLSNRDTTQGLAAQEAVMFAPHRRAMADWTSKADPFYKTAELENRQNINERTLTSNIINADTQARRLEENARQADLKQETQRTRAEADMIRARAIEFKNHGAEVFESGSRLMAKFPDGTVREVGKSGMMDRRDELELIGKNQLAAAQAGGGQFFTGPGGVTRNNARDPNGPLPEEGAVPLTGSGSSSRGSEISVTERIKLREQAAERLRDTNSKVYDWTEIKGGKVVMKPPQKEGWIFGKSQAALDAERKEVADMLWAIENGVGDPVNRGKGVVRGAGTTPRGGVYTNKQGEQTPYEEEGPDPYNDLPDGVNPGQATPRFNVNERSTTGAGPTKEAASRLTTQAAARDAEDLSGIKTVKLPDAMPEPRTLWNNRFETEAEERARRNFDKPESTERPLNRDKTWDQTLGGWFSEPNPAYIGGDIKPVRRPSHDVNLPIEGTLEKPYTGPLNITPTLRQRAIEFIRSQPDPRPTVNDENIEFAIRAGQVR